MTHFIARWAEIGTRPAPRSWWLALFSFCMIVLVIQGALIGGVITSLNQTDGLAHRTSLLAQRTSLIAATVARDEHATCVIQSRGLHITRELTISMEKIHELLTIPPTTPAERAQAAQTPPRVRAIVRSLNKHLETFTELESHQPKTRNC